MTSVMVVDDALVDRVLVETVLVEAGFQVFGLEVHVISTAEIRERYPLINTDDVIGGTWIATDGQIIDDR